MRRMRLLADQKEPFPWMYLGLGLGYGQILWGLGFVATGAGHGCYVLIGLAAAPLSLAGSIPVAFVAPLFWWGLVGWAAGQSYNRYWFALLLFLMLAHYASLPWVLTAPSPFADWRMLPKVKPVAYQAFAIYATGQFALCARVVFRVGYFAILWARRLGILESPDQTMEDDSGR